ncbi:glycoside hydrolase superfamily [Phlyctochytrium arcticum]|nr:glycoside hydrolase superfamily [Phlyctochytrium arcticum]
MANPPPPVTATWWQPPSSPPQTWHWQLSKSTSLNLPILLSSPVQILDTDLFDTPPSTIQALHAASKTVICYFSAGSYEDWRPDRAGFPRSIIGKGLDGWPGEYWLDIRGITVPGNQLASILSARLDMAKTKGCDAVEPDNVDAYINSSGFPLSGIDQITFNSWLADAAHARNLSIGLKNDVDQIGSLVSKFDWALNEECVRYGECAKLAPFKAANKAVFGVEYSTAKGGFDAACAGPREMGFNWLVARLELGGWVYDCTTKTERDFGGGSGSGGGGGGGGGTNDPAPNAGTRPSWGLGNWVMGIGFVYGLAAVLGLA